MRQDFDRCVNLYKDFVKESSTDARQLLGIAESISNDANGNKSVLFAPEERYYDSNKWYALSKRNKKKVLKERSIRNGWKEASK